MQKRLRSARKHAGYSSAAQAAKTLGVNRRTYSGHESGSLGFGRETALIYARCFGVHVEWLLSGSGALRPAQDDAVVCAGVCAAGLALESLANAPGSSTGRTYDPVIFAEAAEMVRTFKRDLGFRFVSTPDYLRLIETFYQQAHMARQNISR